MEIIFPAKWMYTKDFEDVLETHNPLISGDNDVKFIFPDGCSLLVDAALRTLSLMNQLCQNGKNVSVHFNDILFSYLDRMGFLTALAPEIVISPPKPEISSHNIHFGSNQNLVEISLLPPGRLSEVQELPLQLAERIVLVLSPTDNVTKEFQAEMFTVFSELIGNYFEHSESKITGYVVAQTYKTGRLRVAVSDSGLGIINTIRRDRSGEFKNKTDSQLLLDVFNEGISRHGTDTGRSCGLTRCGQISIKYATDLTVRMPDCEVHLHPGRSKKEQNVAYFRSNLGRLQGTHLSFTFTLDKKD